MKTRHRMRLLLCVLSTALYMITESLASLSDPAMLTSSHPVLGAVLSEEESSLSVSRGQENLTDDYTWPMVAADVARTSRTLEEIRGRLAPLWYKPIEPYISQKSQIIAANGLLYVSTAGGLYALDAHSGSEAWIYATEMPLGNSPTIYNGVAYVGGFDHLLHAIDAVNGPGANNQPLWTFQGGAGFHTNPLVVGDILYAGNRDGWMYAIYAHDHPSRGTLAWKYQTEGPILLSAAYADGTIYFASNDGHAYALDAATGALVWKSAKLPGSGFHSWWPVVYQDKVIFPGSSNYRTLIDPGPQQHLHELDRDDLYGDVPAGTLIGSRDAEGLVDATRILQYYEQKPWRRTYIVLDRGTGMEVTYDFDGDQQPEYAPITWFGTKGAGNRYPPVAGSDGRLYQTMHYIADQYIPQGNIVGWEPGTSAFSTPMTRKNAVDEPVAYSGGGTLIYWSRCCDRAMATMDTASDDRWIHYEYDLQTKIPGYNWLYDAYFGANLTDGVYRGANGSVNGLYGNHADQNPPIPYQGKLYIHRSNAVIAFAPGTTPTTALPLAPVVNADTGPEVPSSTILGQMLVNQIQGILDAGHLRPGYLSSGLFNLTARKNDDLIDYWHNTSDLIYTLVIALPYLPEAQQGQVREYLEQELSAYPPWTYTHNGWAAGAAREAFEMPPEIASDLVNFPPTQRWDGYYDGWTYPPYMFYALWRYAEAFGGARELFDRSRNRLEVVPADAYLVDYPQVHNAYIAGYLGYLNLQHLAGDPESTAVRAELDRLLDLRAATFDKDVPWSGNDYRRVLAVARNFMYLTPELGGYLRDEVLAEVQAALDEYDYVAPYWFVVKAEEGYRENVMNTFYDRWALFQAKALILQEPGTELMKYLDVPAVQVGDLFYIQNLVRVLESGQVSGLTKTGVPSVAKEGDILAYTLSFSGYETPVTVTDTLPMGVGVPSNITVLGSTEMPLYIENERQLIWSDFGLGGQAIEIQYEVEVIGGQPAFLENTAVLVSPGVAHSEASAVVMVNPHRIVLPLIMKDWQG